MEAIGTQDFKILRGLNLSHKAEESIIKEFVVEMDAVRWQEIESCKERFLKDGIDPHNSLYMYPEVADSWIRSKNYGVDPYQTKLGKNLSSRELMSLIRDKASMIDIAYEFIGKNIDLLTTSNYHMCLTDENGILLFSAGEKNKIETFEAINAVPGAIWTEELIGTNCHSMCINLKRPVQLIGPYYYCKVVEDNIGSGTPIMDEDGKVIGVLLVISVASPEKQVAQTNLLSWVISAGLAIESELRLKKQSYFLGLANKTLKSTMEVIGEGCIILDWRMNIAYINREAADIFNIKDKEAIGKPFKKLCKSNLPINDVLETGKTINKFETVFDSLKHQSYDVDIEPLVNNDNSRNTNGLFLRIRKLHQGQKNEKATDQEKDSFSSIIGNSKPLQIVIHNARNVANHDGGVLLIGESGTGKELFARAIHDESRRNGPYIAINCASIPKSLFESELFGYEGGAFTGAERRGRIGKIELARGGTLFLDEIGEMPLELQPVLLRVLEDKQIMRVGGTKYISLDFKVVAATNKDLWKMVLNKEFREDLYFRLAVFKLTIPPLRSRGNDINKLAETFIKESYDKGKFMKCPVLSPEVCDIFLNYDWPGNVRQLKNVITYALAMVTGNTIKKNHLPSEFFDTLWSKSTGESDDIKSVDDLTSMERIEIEAIKDAMKKTGKNVKDASELLGLGRSTVYRKLKQYNIEF
ncbi:sigma-54-dependent Fis family transcriptional regulator [Desulfitobacterium sp. PCE1]|uniref:sigma-54-dependent Fis family transcriptional regulator n=1 Tax=Desulfitobacterium sp. PCE1 TaxID=146907 RepID=UPI00036FA429|nr:sigma 54-interacting transcriptional regulator [Desulfitobacterium sp. PCE1]